MQIYFDIGVASSAFKPANDRMLGDKNVLPTNSEPAGRIVIGEQLQHQVPQHKCDMERTQVATAAQACSSVRLRLRRLRVPWFLCLQHLRAVACILACRALSLSCCHSMRCMLPLNQAMAQQRQQQVNLQQPAYSWHRVHTCFTKSPPRHATGYLHAWHHRCYRWAATSFRSCTRCYVMLFSGLYGKLAPVSTANMVHAVQAGAFSHSAFSRISPGEFIQAGRRGSRRLGDIAEVPGLAVNTDLASPGPFRLTHSRPGTVSLSLSENDEDPGVKERPDYRCACTPCSPHLHSSSSACHRTVKAGASVSCVWCVRVELPHKFQGGMRRPCAPARLLPAKTQDWLLPPTFTQAPFPNPHWPILRAQHMILVNHMHWPLVAGRWSF
eukprot:GHRQ01023139.1.p1 GENE.GHRQ01023139.1~~GHRQ01023139.1.p1  ORF type:complete len:383 (+),score=69.69 GHRQ01023139.1:148-1296(+)